MNNYKEVSFLISSLFVIYFFKDIITTLIILVILSAISALIMKADLDDKNSSTVESSANKTVNNTEKLPQYTKSSNFQYNK